MALYLSIHLPGETDLQGILKRFENYQDELSFGLDRDGNRVDIHDTSAIKIIFDTSDISLALTEQGIDYSRRCPHLKSNLLAYASHCQSNVELARELGGVAYGCMGDEIQVHTIVDDVQRWFGENPAPPEIDWKRSVNRLLTLHSDFSSGAPFYGFNSKEVSFSFRKIVDAFLWNNISVGSVDEESMTFKCWNGKLLFEVKPIKSGYEIYTSRHERNFNISHCVHMGNSHDNEELRNRFQEAANKGLWTQAKYDETSKTVCFSTNVRVLGEIHHFSDSTLLALNELDACVEFAMSHL